MALGSLQNLADMANGNSILHRTSPTVKLIFTLVFIINVVAVPRYEFSMLLPFFLYIVWASTFCLVPAKLLIKRGLQVFPLVFFIGISNLWLDTKEIFAIGNFAISGGLISFGVLIMKATLTVSAAVILAATTPINMLAGGLRQLHLPCVLILQLLLTWRYLEMLTTEGKILKQAYLQRNPQARHIAMRHWPNIIGTLMLRSLDRADRIYNAMQCRLFHAGSIPRANRQVTWGEVAALVGGVAICIIMGKYNLCKLLGEVLT